ncbi:MAG: bifunctional folylpolyglutamate synthase/dihydrofolate synthase [Tindallia sp. MSAO_Bac2]|nr:MAG: bifunctional folylpolyglutamate synthase/dihydrofolate synthase [Tindallia sp. MSAO_Bac2]
MNYQEALTYIHGTYKFGSKLGLTNIKRLLALLNNPEKKLKFIHVAGTNGKGSTCSMIQSVLTAAGFRVGLYTSPYIQRFNERIRIDENNIKDDELAYITDQVKQCIEKMLDEGYSHPTEFEVVTAIAMLYYHQQDVDFVILEVGLGGRLDATNAIDKPLLSIITPVDYDHMAYLGDTLTAIASEKAGIIKEAVPVVTGFQHQVALKVLQDKASSLNAPFYQVVPEAFQMHDTNLHGQTFSVTLRGKKYDHISVSLPGPHQAENCMLALTSLQILEEAGYLQVSPEALEEGLSNVRWMGRLEIVHDSPLVIIDGAHNVQGAKSLSRSLDLLLQNVSVTWLIGMLEDKEIDEVLNTLVPHMDRIVVTQPEYHRAMKAESLGERLYNRHPNVWVEPSMKNAIHKALEVTPASGAVLCAGSLYMLGQIRSYFMHDNDGDDKNE